MNKVTTLTEAVNKIKDGDTVLFSGFYARGTAPDVIDEVIRQGKKDLTIVNNDGGNDTQGNYKGVGKLIHAGTVKKLICSWCGRTPEVPQKVDAGEMELELVPQGSLAERIRAAGFGLGGILTPTGLDTLIEEKWGQRVNLNGKDWLYQTPIKGNVTVLEAYQADEAGNLIMENTQKNFSTVMAYASDLVIASVIKPIVPAGSLDPDAVTIPGILVDLLIQQEKEYIHE